MRVALLSLQDEIAGGEADGITPGTVKLRGLQTFAGRSLIRHQLDCALSLGCERIVCIAPFSSADDLAALRKVSGEAGARFDTVVEPRRFGALITTGDTVLVFGDGVFVDCELIEKTLGTRHGVISLPVDPGLAAGFERIDAQEAWAGVMQVPGSLVERLTDLPDDVAVAPALLRIALQARLARHLQDPRVLAERRLSLPKRDAAMTAHEADWVKARARPSSFAAPFRAAIERLSMPKIPDLLERSGRLRAVTGLSGLAIGMAVVAAIKSYVLPALILCGLGAIGIVVSTIAARVTSQAQFRLKSRSVGVGWLDGLLDAALVVIIAHAGQGPISTISAWFASLMLVGLLRIAASQDDERLAELAGDRVLLCFVLVVAQWQGVLLTATQILAIAIVFWMIGSTFLRKLTTN